MDNSLIAKFRQNQYVESMTQVFGFQREFWRNRAQTGSVKASSSGLARAMVEPYWDESCAQDVLEVGSGTGAISEKIFRRMQAGDKLTIVEINDNFLGMTRRKMAQKFGHVALTGRVSFVNADFLLHQMPADHYSRICCSLPFNNFAPEIIQQIFQEMFRVCQPRGIIVFYEYILLRRIRYWLSLGRLRDLKKIEAVLTNKIGQYGIERLPIFSNFPPAMVYVLRKPYVLKNPSKT
jgi:phospholipid N-methyltransferase